MHVYCITILDLKPSLEAAQRCQESGKAFGLDIALYPATTPQSDPVGFFGAMGWPMDKFEDNKWSRKLPTMACFLSHYELWQACSFQDECYLILEHDAVIVDRVPNLHPEEKLLCNVAKPSFGRFNTPKEGFRPFSSNPRGYLKGAHGYILSPSGAKEILQRVKEEAEPADLFLSSKRFPWMTEFYPWPVACEDSFSTVQKEAGCMAKHRDVHPV